MAKTARDHMQRRIARWKANPRRGRSSWSWNSFRNDLDWRLANRAVATDIPFPTDHPLDGVEY